MLIYTVAPKSIGIFFRNSLNIVVEASKQQKLFILKKVLAHLRFT